MFLCSSVNMKLLIFAFLLALLEVSSAEFDLETIEDLDECMACICYASSKCKATSSCDGEYCGPFNIRRPYWIDAGKKVLPGDHPDRPEAFEECAVEYFCAKTIVEGYIQNLAKDCDGNGVINCDDFLAMHKRGGWNCNGTLEELPENYYVQYRECMEEGLQYTYYQK